MLKDALRDSGFERDFIERIREGERSTNSTSRPSKVGDPIEGLLPWAGVLAAAIVIFAYTGVFVLDSYF